MGFGQALGQGVQAYQTEAQRNQANQAQDQRLAMAEENLALNKATTAQNISASKTAQKRTQQVMQNETEDRRIKANNLKAFNAFMGGGGRSQNATNETQVQNQKIAQMESDALDQKMRYLTKDVFQNMYADIGETGQYFNYEQMNDYIAQEPTLQMMMPNPIVQYNYLNEKHKMEILKMADTSTEDTGAMQKSITKLAEDGLIGFDVITNKPIDLMGLSQMVGAPQMLPKSLNNKAMYTLNNNMKTSMTEDAKVEASNQAYEVEPPKMETFPNGKSPEEVIYAAKMYGQEVPEGAEEMAEKNKQLLEQYEMDKGQAEFTKTMEKAERGEATKRELDQATNYAQNMEKGKARDQTLIALENAKDATQINEIYSKPTADAGDVAQMANIENGNRTSNGKVAEKAVELDKDESLVNNMNGLMGRVMTIMEGTDGMITGPGGNLIAKAAMVDSNMTENIINYFKTGKPVTREMLLNTIATNTEVGSIVADYVKATSGTAVTEGEFERLHGIIAGIAQGDPEALITAMQTFRDGRARSLQGVYDNDKYARTKLPETVYGFKKIGPQYQPDYRSQALEARKNGGQSADVEPAPGGGVQQAPPAADANGTNQPPVLRDQQGNIVPDTPPAWF